MRYIPKLSTKAWRLRKLAHFITSSLPLTRSVGCKVIPTQEETSYQGCRVPSVKGSGLWPHYLWSSISRHGIWALCISKLILCHLQVKKLTAFWSLRSVCYVNRGPYAQLSQHSSFSQLCISHVSWTMFQVISSLSFYHKLISMFYHLI